MAIPVGLPRTAGIQLGEAAAAAILALRASDGSNMLLLLDFDYQEGTRPGEYRFVPGTSFAFAPGLGDVTPFVLERGSQFRARPQYRVQSKKYAADDNEINSDAVTKWNARARNAAIAAWISPADELIGKIED